MVIRPGAKLQRAVLLVKGEIPHFDFAGRLVDRWWEPSYFSIVGNHCVGVEGDFVGPVSTKEKWKIKTEKSSALLLIGTF